MKVCLVAHGYPPELVGGTEKAVQNLARGLVRRGIEVVVVAGSMQFEGGFRTSEDSDSDPVSGGTIRVRRIHRADLYFDHWQKSASARTAEAFRAILREERPDLVHVQHWIRLTRDLVLCAAREGVPAAATLHDFWTTCLIAFRVRPDTKEFCEAPPAAHPCLACAGQVPPKTPWMAPEALHMALAERRGDLVRELELARAVLAPSRSHAEAVARLLGVDDDRIALRVVPHGRDLVARPAPTLPRPADHGRLVLGAWSHLHPLKGQDLLLDALERLPDPSRVELHLAGSEPDEAFASELHRRAQGLDVTFHGPFDAESLFEHPVSRVHAMVSATRATESWGLVVDEAAALGLPMVLPRAGAFPERLEEGCGVLFYAARDAAALAQVLGRLWEEPGLLERVRAAAPPLGELVPDVESHVEAVLEVYRGVVEAGVPEVPAEDWWGGAMRKRSEEAWDASLSQRSAAELGFS